MTGVRRFLWAALMAGFGVGAFSTAALSAFPDRPIRLILSHPPGGSADVIARLMQLKLERLLGQPVIIENRAGAGGIIAMDALSKSKPDGYTIGMGASGALATSPALGETVPYDPLKSFQPIAAVSGQPFMLAVPGDSALKTLNDVIELEKRGNSKLTIGHGGAIMHLTAALFNSAAGLKIPLVTYKGTGPVVTDLLGAHIPLGIIDIPSAEAALTSGKVRALAISSSGRFEGMPDLPTFQEAGLKGFEAVGFLGILAPAGVPREELATLNKAFATVLRDPEVLARFKSFGSRPMMTDPKEFGDFIASEIKKWTAVVDAAQLRQK
ncbi:MAG: tripartite tricarboxylate transporter substrate binding protein [Hyphomicrobiales bacterium]|nr:tripartite tricarboxylate transporter substrate binding protein [Alphaproteobacteria bacterium]